MNPVTTVIIFLNILVFLLWSFLDSPHGFSPFMVDNFLVSWSHLMDGRWWTLLSSVFSHNMFLHLFLNMIVLNSFGPIVETAIGRRRYLVFYLVAGIVSSLSHALVSALIMHDPQIPALGASGAISGVVLLFSLLFPRERILLFFFFPLPALAGAVLFIGLDVWGLVAQAEGGGLPIGHGAHLGGALTGIIYYFVLRKMRRRAVG